MKIESINTEYTKDVNKVALDFDVDIDDNFLKSLQSKSECYKRNGEDQKGALGTQSSDNISKKIPYISFCRIKENNRVLTIAVTTVNHDWKSGNGSPVTIEEEHIAIINKFLSEIEDKEKEKKRERDDLLDKIANNTGLRRNDRQPTSKKRAYATDLNL